MTALIALAAFVLGLMLAEFAADRAWRRFVAKQRERTERIGGKSWRYYRWDGEKQELTEALEQNAGETEVAQ